MKQRNQQAEIHNGAIDEAQDIEVRDGNLQVAHAVAPQCPAVDNRRHRTVGAATQIWVQAVHDGVTQPSAERVLKYFMPLAAIGFAYANEILAGCSSVRR